ncbi:hypothetical protein [Spirosoma aerophilum]
MVFNNKFYSLGIVVFLILIISSCSSKETEITSDETVLVNSAIPSNYLVGTYPVTFIGWTTPSLIGQLEGVKPKYSDANAFSSSIYTLTPMTSRYNLIVEHGLSQDSIRVYIDGLGRGPVFTHKFLGAYKVSTPYQAVYLVQDKYYGLDFSLKGTSQTNLAIALTRRDFTDRTEFSLNLVTKEAGFFSTRNSLGIVKH